MTGVLVGDFVGQRLFGKDVGQQHVVDAADVVQKVKGLKYKANLGVAQVRQRHIGELRQVVTKHADLAGVVAVEAADDMQQRRLARARATHERQQLALFDLQRYAAQHLVLTKAFAQVGDGHQRLGGDR